MLAIGPHGCPNSGATSRPASRHLRPARPPGPPDHSPTARRRRVNAFLDRPLGGAWPYLWLDATYLEQREGGRIVSVAAIIAVAVSAAGRREIVGLHIGPSEAETFLSTFLKRLVKRGLKGVRADRGPWAASAPRTRRPALAPHRGLKQAIARVLGGTWHCCRVHFMRNALAHAGRNGKRVVAAFIATAFAQDDAGAAKAQWRQVADQVCPKLPKLAASDACARVSRRPAGAVGPGLDVQLVQPPVSGHPRRAARDNHKEGDCKGVAIDPNDPPIYDS